MPKHSIHRLVDKALLGKEYPQVHRYMDEPAKYLGARHRIARHNLATALLLFARYKDPKAFMSSILHTALDQVDANVRVRARSRRSRR
jgi:hypothetical protein